jgi:adenylate kinase family enzyme
VSSSPIGTRIQVCGPSCAGKTTLAAELARRFELEFVELDALFWEPNWQEPDREKFAAKVKEAISGPGWVLAGNYTSRASTIVWPVVETIVWLDFPLRSTLPRIVARSWRRSRSNELLWGTNYERFWPQLKVWSPNDSLLAYNIRHGRQFRRRLEEAMANPKLGHIRWVRLHSPRELRRWLESPESTQAQPDASR